MNRKYMLRKNHEFQSIIANKKQKISKSLIIYYKKQTPTKIGISVPKKFAKAVERNYNKRQIKAILVSNPQYLQLEYALVIILRRPFLKLKFEKKKKELTKLLERIINESK